MGFVELEDKGKKMLEQYPVLKRTCKRIYQLSSYILTSKKIKSEGSIICMSPNDEYEYFYGYYDKSPWDADDHYMIALKVKNAYKTVAPKEPGELVLIDTKNNNNVIVVNKVNSWNVQQGCMAQWLGPDFKSRIIYNDFRQDKYCSVIFNVNKMQEEKVLPLPIYDVSKDGKVALSLDFSRLHRLRPGYGYSNLPDTTLKEKCPNKTCIWKMNIEDEKIVELFKYTDLAAFETNETMKNAEHKVNHLMISPNGKRFMMLHRWFDKGRKHTRLITVNMDGKDMFNLSDDVFVSHCYWKNDNEILSFLRKNETGNHYYLMKDKTHEYSLCWPRLTTDGHCSYSPDGKMIVTDSYPNRKRLAFVYLCIEEQQQPVRIAKVFAPFRYDNDTRCDLHPRWNHSGNKICIDSVHNGKRGLYVIPITKKDIPVLPKEKPIYQKGKYKIVYVITNCKNSGPMNQTLNIIKNLDRNIFEPIVVTLFLEDLGNSVVQRYLDVVPELHCLGMTKIEAIFKGKKKLSELLEKIKPDIIQGLGMPPYTMSLKYKKAVHLVTLRNYCYQDYPDKYGKVFGKILAHKDMHLIKKQIKKQEIFITCSESLSKLYEEKNKLKFDFIRNGVDVKKYTYVDEKQKKEMKKKLNIPTNKIVVSYSGQFIDRKDQQFAIEGILDSKKANDIFIILMGEGPNLDRLKKRYEDDKRILFTGNINNVNEYLQSSDVYVSVSKSEGMPNGVLEAMSTGLPVLLSDIPQHLEILEIEEGFGLSYKIDDKENFKIKFGELLEKDLNQMGKMASNIANNELSAVSMSEKYQTLYYKLINNHNRRNKK